jgi:hypothetical protein
VLSYHDELGFQLRLLDIAEKLDFLSDLGDDWQRHRLP